jgi:hypothetical protein
MENIVYLNYFLRIRIQEDNQLRINQIRNTDDKK